MRALLLFLRRRIALKLTLTLVGFTAIAGLAAALYLNHALEALAVESLETRLAALERVLHDEARDLLRGAVPEAVRQAFAQRASRATGARVTVDPARRPVAAESASARAASRESAITPTGRRCARPSPGGWAVTCASAIRSRPRSSTWRLRCATVTASWACCGWPCPWPR
jgi:hypothetical protein